MTVNIILKRPVCQGRGDSVEEVTIKCFFTSRNARLFDLIRCATNISNANARIIHSTFTRNLLFY